MPKTKTKKFRGYRTAGGGTHKNRRGAGSRGGRGNAGVWKHHAVRTRMNNIRQGKYGFTNHTTKMVEVVNVDELGKMDVQEISLPGKKVLGKGKVTQKLVVSASSFSEAAKRKIEAAGGEVVVI